jgi:hypothetical protein
MQMVDDQANLCKQRENKEKTSKQRAKETNFTFCRWSTTKQTYANKEKTKRKQANKETNNDWDCERILIHEADDRRPSGKMYMVDDQKQASKQRLRL